MTLLSPYIYLFQVGFFYQRYLFFRVLTDTYLVIRESSQIRRRPSSNRTGSRKYPDHASP